MEVQLHLDDTVIAFKRTMPKHGLGSAITKPETAISNNSRKMQTGAGAKQWANYWYKF